MMERIQTETLIFMYLFSPRSKSSFPWQRNILAMVRAPRYMFGEAGTKQYLPSGCIFYVMQGMDVFSQHLGLTPGENPRGQCIPVPTEGQGKEKTSAIAGMFPAGNRGSWTTADQVWTWPSAALDSSL